MVIEARDLPENVYTIRTVPSPDQDRTQHLRAVAQAAVAGDPMAREEFTGILIDSVKFLLSERPGQLAVVLDSIQGKKNQTIHEDRGIQLNDVKTLLSMGRATLERTVLKDAGLMRTSRLEHRAVPSRVVRDAVAWGQMGGIKYMNQYYTTEKAYFDFEDLLEETRPKLVRPALGNMAVRGDERALAILRRRILEEIDKFPDLQRRIAREALEGKVSAEIKRSVGMAPGSTNANKHIARLRSHLDKTVFSSFGIRDLTSFHDNRIPSGTLTDSAKDGRLDALKFFYQHYTTEEAFRDYAGRWKPNPAYSKVNQG